MNLVVDPLKMWKENTTERLNDLEKVKEELLTQFNN
jgi:hypothetical protein